MAGKIKEKGSAFIDFYYPWEYTFYQSYLLLKWQAGDTFGALLNRFSNEFTEIIFLMAG
ncbi:hypothetical protein [Sediminibacillus halophilus]|uniref:Uncharacterized protein n=1 Tax=Sediminibacillus halophilus TaxID=482461 RepID=A0A1G9NIR2_9BACI|nr:hypothetical protein [Sediminibacillus halophilus]SDL86478.1 hypothetical protein SAMN05216244_1025 [Sediminibacillus halophilus]